MKKYHEWIKTTYWILVFSHSKAITTDLHKTLNRLRWSTHAPQTKWHFYQSTHQQCDLETPQTFSSHPTLEGMLRVILVLFWSPLMFGPIPQSLIQHGGGRSDKPNSLNHFSLHCVFFSFTNESQHFLIFNHSSTVWYHNRVALRWCTRKAQCHKC